MANFLKKLLTLGANKEMKKYEQRVEEINALESDFINLSDDELKTKTQEFRERYKSGESLDDLLNEAFATVREASKRVLGMRHFDVQLIGGMVLHEGEIAEMKTGEGKTLVSTLAGYLNALSGKGVHIVTVNDYLAKRDSEWMGQLYEFLGMKVGLLQNGMSKAIKRDMYKADVIYGTNSEFGFDYLRDNMVTSIKDRVQNGHSFAIVDEVDSILIDEARTPLIISGAGAKSSETYQKFARGVRGLKEGRDYEKDEAKHTIAATEEGLAKIERNVGIDNIYSDLSGQYVNHLQQALKAQYMFQRDVDYVIQDGEVKIVDEFTGRIMEGRRYSEGLHQALEAKEGVLVREENQTLATITLQNYFRLYDKLSGMTGTAMTEDSEFRDIYDLGVQAIPPNKPVIRKDEEDVVYRTIDIKFDAVANDVQARHEKGQPVLVGTVSIESSEKLSRLLDKRGIKHEILNAKNHSREAGIIAEAGRVGQVTIATNMAGRGTDIVLGGNEEDIAKKILKQQGIDPEQASEEEYEQAFEQAKKICEKERQQVLDAGGLAVIGTERHESRRIDNQLRGRAGRQGDPGEAKFFLSLEDDLMRLFAGDRLDSIAALMKRMDLPDDMPIQAKQVTKAIEGAQQKVETMNFSARKNVLEYDDVMNQQRQVIYAERDRVLEGKDLHAHIEEVMHDVVESAIEEYVPEKTPIDEWDYDGIQAWVENITGRLDFDIDDVDFEDEEELIEVIYNYLLHVYAEKTKNLGEELMRKLEAQVMLRVIDTRWMSHLSEMDYIKAGIGLRGFGQRDPLVEYKQEAFIAFSRLINSMYEDFIRTILHVQVTSVEERQEDALRGASYSGPDEVDGDRGQASAFNNAGNISTNAEAGQGKAKTYVKAEDPNNPYAGTGRNDPCPCGSGKKYKKCHGRRA